MSHEPIMIYYANVNDEIEEEMQEQPPSRIHQICDIDDGRDHHKPFLSVLEYDSQQQELKPLNLSNSILLERGGINSLSKYTDDSFIISCSKEQDYDWENDRSVYYHIAMIFDVVTMQKLK